MRLTFNGKRLRRFLALTALLWLFGCAGVPGNSADPHALNDDEIRRALLANVVRRRHGDDEIIVTGPEIFSENGSVTWFAGRVPTRGSFEIARGVVCVRLGTAIHRDCWRLYRNERGQYFTRQADNDAAELAPATLTPQ